MTLTMRLSPVLPDGATLAPGLSLTKMECADDPLETPLLELLYVLAFISLPSPVFFANKTKIKKLSTGNITKCVILLFLK